eukprot:297102_1
MCYHCYTIWFHDIYQMKTCGKSFASRSYLRNVHLKIHQKQKNAKCRFCDRRFTDPSTLHTHVNYMQKMPKTIHKEVCMYNAILKRIETEISDHCFITMIVINHSQ